jgi:hypothetical protein
MTIIELTTMMGIAGWSLWGLGGKNNLLKFMHSGVFVMEIIVPDDFISFLRHFN